MVVFAKTQSSPRLYAAPNGGAAGEVWVAYYLPVAPAGAPEPIGLSEALAGQRGATVLGGSFVLAAAGADIETYAAQIVQALDDALKTFPGDRAIAWLTTPEAPSAATTLLVGLNSGGTAINVALNVPFIQNGLYFTLNSSVSVATADDTALTFSVPGGLQRGLYFSSAVGSTGTILATTPAATLPLSGDAAGALTLATQFQRTTLADTLRWGMQLLYTDPADAPGNFRSQLYPLARGDVPNATDQIGFAVQLDPSDVANSRFAGRTAFAFDGTTDGQQGVTLASGYRTAWGDRIDLQPVSTAAAGSIAAGLVLTPGNPGTAGAQQFAFAPYGDFVLDVPPSKQGAPQPLLCGLTPTETMTFTPKQDRLRFLPGKPAYALGYPPVQASTLGPPVDTNAPLVTNTFTTSWATVINAPGTGAGIHYSAQPKGQPLFGLDDVVTPAAPGTLGPVDPGYLLPKAPDFSAPLLPYALAVAAGVPTGFDAAAVSGVEARIAAPVRRALIGGPTTTQTSVAAHHRRASLVGDSASIQATTPMGLVATIGSDGRWDSVGLALNAEAQVRMSFCKPPAELQQALQSSELFLVIANAEHVGGLTGMQPEQSMQPPADPPRFFNAMTIADWQIAAQVGENKAYGDYNDVVIVKGCRGSVADLVCKTSAWTQAETFSAPSYVGSEAAPEVNDIVVLSTWLDNYIKAAEARAGNPDFSNFLEIVHSETWTGILVLKAKLIALPKDLGGLLATIDRDDTYAHHFGVTVSPVDAATVQVNKTSAMFELVYYVAPGYADAVTTTEPLPPAGSPYDFQLLTMKALFENSAIAAFASKAQLTLGAWFDDLVLRMGPAGNSYNTIFLLGSYQSQGGHTGYVLDSETSNQFYPDSTAITKVEVVKAQYVSIDDGSSRFDIWGFLDFALIGGPESPFDMFSFGDPGGNDANRTGLSFSALALYMAVDSKQAKTFVFDPSKLAFDLAQSTPRPGSLYRDFALRTPAIVIGTKDADPLQRGYLTVGTTGPVLTGVAGRDADGGGDGRWYGLSYGLDMGSIGALAGNAGLAATVLTAWAPKSAAAAPTAGDSYPVRLGLALPGVNPTAKLLSLEGVLRLGIGNLNMSHAAVGASGATPAEDAARFWVLSLNDIGLKFLGFFKIPPNGSIGFTCFGNPEANADPTALGWYAVYNQDPPKQNAVEGE